MGLREVGPSGEVTAALLGSWSVLQITVFRNKQAWLLPGLASGLTMTLFPHTSAAIRTLSATADPEASPRESCPVTSTADGAGQHTALGILWQKRHPAPHWALSTDGQTVIEQKRLLSQQSRCCSTKDTAPGSAPKACCTLGTPDKDMLPCPGRPCLLLQTQRLPTFPQIPQQPGRPYLAHTGAQSSWPPNMP